MSSNTVFARGRAEVVVPASEKIVVFTRGSAKVSQVVSDPNMPDANSLLSTVNNTTYTSSAFTNETTVVVESLSEADVFYQVGSDPVIIEEYNRQLQGAPTAETAAATLTIAELLTGIVTMTQATGGNVNLTLPTGTLSDAGLELDIGESFDWSLINLSAAAADTVTVAAGTGHTVVGVMVVQGAHATTGGLYGNAGRFRTRKTAANTFITYRIG